MGGTGYSSDEAIKRSKRGNADTAQSQHSHSTVRGLQRSPNDAALGLFPVLCKYATKQEQADFAAVEVA